MAKARTTALEADTLLDAALGLIAERGFTDLPLSEIAAVAKVPLAAVYRTFPTRLTILDALIRRTDLALLSEDVDAAEAPRDRLFDLLMRRFEALAPHRETLRVIHRDLRRHPVVALAAARSFVHAMQWMLDAAGLADGVMRAWRAPALAALYLSVVPVWLDDDDPGRARTMAALDRRLRRAEELMSRGRPKRTHDATSAESA